MGEAKAKAKYIPREAKAKAKYILIDCGKLLKIKYNILLRLSLYFQLKNSNFLSSFILF